MSPNLLGVFIDAILNWKYQIHKIRCKLAKSLSVLYKANEVLDTYSLYIIYCAILLPYLSHCAEIWGGAYSSNLEVITLLQKGLLELFYRAGRYSMTMPTLFL